MMTYSFKKPGGFKLGGFKPGDFKPDGFVPLLKDDRSLRSSR